MAPSRLKQNPGDRQDRSSMQGRSEQHGIDQFRKTKLCRFHESGRCRYAETCPFAHSLDELEEQPDLKKTSICKSWQQGCCMLSPEQCPFAHGKEDLKKKTTQLVKKKKAPVQELFEGSETTTCYSDRSGASSSRERRSSEASATDAFSPRGQLDWDPIGISEDQAPLKGFYGIYNYGIAGQSDKPRREGGKKSTRNRKSHLLRTAMDIGMPPMMSEPSIGCFDPLKMMPNLVPTAVGPNQFIMVPASTVIWDMPVQNLYQSQSQHDVLEMLKQAQPDHYED